MDDSEYSADSDHNIGADGNQGMFSEHEQTLFDSHEDAAYDYVTGPQVHPLAQPSPPSAKQSPPLAPQFPCFAHETPSAGQQCAVPAVAEAKAEVKSAPPMSAGHGNVQDIHVTKSNTPFVFSSMGEGDSIKCIIKEEGLKSQRKLEKKKRKKAEGWTKADNIEGHVDFKELNEVLEYLGEPQPPSTQLPKKKLRKKVKGRTGEADRKPTLMNGKSGTPSTTASESENDSKTVNKKSTAMNGEVKHSEETTRLNSSTSLSAHSSEVMVNGVTANVDDVPNGEGDFKEVHRRRKRIYPPPVAHLGKTNKSTPKIYHRPAQQNTANTVVSAAQPKAVLPAEVVDLSLNSFPSLESALFPDSRSSCGDSKSVSAYTESTRTSLLTESTTDDDRDSITSQAAGGGRCSWAKIAAKSSHPGQHTTSSFEQTDVADAFFSPSTHVTAGEKVPAALLTASDRVADSVMASSLTSEIEFGTVMANGDPAADQSIQRILSRSHRLTDFKAQGQSKVTSRSPICISNQDRSAGQERRTKNKAVEFVDKYEEQKRADIKLMFGFVDGLGEANGGSSTISSTDNDGRTLISPVTYNNPSGGKDADVGIASDAKDSQAPCLPHTVDVLPRILSAGHHNAINSSSSAPDNTGEFNLHSAVTMLRKEWDQIVKLRESCGDKKIKFSVDLSSV